MSLLVVLLVLASAGLHAYWNFLLKRAGGGQLAVGLSKVAELVWLAPIALWAVARGPGQAATLLGLAAVGAVLVTANYALLAAAYRAADLSSTYPIARGGILLALPIAGYVAFGERLTAGGLAGLACIVGGIGLQLTGRASPNRRGAALALGAALTAAAYTLWDKHAVGSVAPLAYFATYSVLVGVAYGLYVVRREGLARARDCWQAQRVTLIHVGLANGLGYLLVLYALRTGVSSYVIGLRQVSILFGALAGWRLLGERPTRAAWTGIVAIGLGCLLVATSG